MTTEPGTKQTANKLEIIIHRKCDFTLLSVEGASIDLYAAFAAQFDRFFFGVKDIFKIEHSTFNNGGSDRGANLYFTSADIALHGTAVCSLDVVLYALALAVNETYLLHEVVVDHVFAPPDSSKQARWTTHHDFTHFDIGNVRVVDLLLRIFFLEEESQSADDFDTSEVLDLADTLEEAVRELKAGRSSKKKKSWRKWALDCTGLDESATKAELQTALENML